MAASGSNVYVIATGDEKNSTSYQPDVFIKVSNDSGKSFGKDINLSLSEGSISERIQLEAIDYKVYVTWWDKTMNDTDTPLMRVSDNGGQSFGDAQVLSANSTTSTTTKNTNASSS